MSYSGHSQRQNNHIQGKLYVVATPIGNLSDLSERAKTTLAQVDVIAAEDTRHSRPLLQHFGINTALHALHDHNEQQQAQGIVERLLNGENWALISDAGTPLVSDPGYRLVDAAQAADIEVLTVPGPSAVIAALSIAGLATDEFGFYGFLPSKTQARQKRLAELSCLTHTWVVFESSHRIAYALADCVETLPVDCELLLARELTKKFEQTKRGSAQEVYAWLMQDDNRRRGEFVLVVSGATSAAEHTLSIEARHVIDVLGAELPTKQAATLAAQITGQKRNAFYDYLLSQKSNSD